MIKFSIKLKNINKGEEVIKNKYKRILMLSMFKMEELALKRSPFDKGFLRQNITLFPMILSEDYTLSSRAPYSEDLEYGNTPRFVKIEPLEKWAERKGITSGKDTYPFAKYVQEKIKREGVNAQPYMRPALNEVENFWVYEFIKQEFSGI